MKKYLFLIVAILFLFVSSVKAEDFSVTGDYIYLYNLNDESVIYEKNANDKTPIASITKVMTSLVALDYIKDLDASVTVTNDDFLNIDGYAKAGFKVGDVVTYRDLLYATLLPSGADAVNVLVNNTYKEKFFAKMNEKAKEIGLLDTKFSNAIGKDSDSNYSTASDVAKMVKYAINNPEFKKIFTAREYKTSNGLMLKSTLTHYGSFDTSLIDGAKSGFTSGAGRSLASLGHIDDIPVILVVIHSDTDKPSNALKDSLTVYNYYEDNYNPVTVLDDDTKITDLNVKWAREKTYSVTGSEKIEKYLPNDASDNLHYEFVGVDEIKINTGKDSKLGVVKVYYGDSLIATSDVFLEENINYFNPLYLLIIGVFVLFIVIFIPRKKRRRRK